MPLIIHPDDVSAEQLEDISIQIANEWFGKYAKSNSSRQDEVVNGNAASTSSAEKES